VEQFIIIAVVLLFAILDAAAKKQRQKQMEAEGESSGSPPDTDGDGIPGEPLPEYTRSYQGGGEGPRAPRSSEGMVPADIWKEIEALARGERSSQPEPRAPEPAPAEGRRASSEGGASRSAPPARISRSSPIRRGQVGVEEVGSRGGIGGRSIHRAHADFGTDPSSRAPSRVPEAPHGSKAVREVRKALVEGGREEARKAVILHEVLGKPLAYREDEAP
jgi:hypothetical protein